MIKLSRLGKLGLNSPTRAFVQRHAPRIVQTFEWEGPAGSFKTIGIDAA